MDKKNDLQYDNCTIFQEKIFDLIDNHSAPTSDSEVNNHIKNCQNCQSYLDNLTRLKNHMQKSPSKGLKPNFSIVKNIIVYKNIKNSLKKKKHFSIWGLVRVIFEFRIPVYQALSGATVVMILFMYIWGPDKSVTNVENSVNQEVISASELYALDTLNFKNTERGQSAKEDSILISFLVPTM